MGEEISDFEKQRLANIAERDALLKKLSLEAQSSGLFPPKMQPSRTPSSRDQSARVKKKTPVKRVKQEEASPVPRRMSSRLRGIAAESEVAKRKAEEQDAALQAAERAKRVRKSDAFSFNEMVVYGQKLSGDSLIGVDVVTKGVAMPYQRTFDEDDIEQTTDKDLKALREEMSGLKLWEAWEPNRIKLTPERIYTMAFHPTETKPLLFAGDKLGHIGILDAAQERTNAIKAEESGDEYEDDEDPDPSFTTLKPHTRTISSIYIHPSTPTRIYTASYDSSIRATDLEKSTSVEQYAPESTSDDVPISGLDMAADDPHVLYWTTLDGEFGRYDTRLERSKPQSVTTWRLAEKKIGGFSLYPARPHYFATASLDRSMRLWDLRMLQAPTKAAGRSTRRQVQEEDDEQSSWVPVGEHYSRLSVSHAAFNSAGQIATSSYDDTIKIYDLSGPKGINTWEQGHTLSEEELKPQTVVRHNCQTGRWVTILRPQWQQNPQSPIQRFCIGNMNRFVDVYSASGDQLAQLGGEGITAVPAVAVFHRSKNWVAGGTASGKICLWM
ncbi:WD domain protein [Aspergillus japonicus CBS 114.51]|uniref:DNA damage-binding protein CMR1 n=2 Tax=Aspergillus TaxID=5052 RepID=A0A2V5HFS8_ASPV1|nr:WD domain protein [Aspergillus japonicus CBS 114.51]PYI21322.1 WD domain protein [Aspergillus violaceofuscus CBS 115571]RAH84529.1 WD domain protein [Aspergillus japonicus CBS 114.51]